MTLTSALRTAATFSADAGAVTSGRIGQRLTNRLIGKVLGNVFRAVWR